MTKNLSDLSGRTIELGSYDFAEIFVSHWRDLKGYPSELIVIHETHHKALAETTLYGNVSQAVSMIVKSAEKPQNPHLPALKHSFTQLIRGAFRVQEGNATYVELIAAATMGQETYERRLKSLPRSYRVALDQFTRALGNPADAIHGNGAQWGIAVTLAKLCSNASVFLKIKDLPPTSSPSLHDFLAHHSPDIYLDKLMSVLSERTEPSALVEIWNKIVLETAVLLKMSLSTIRDQPFYMDLSSAEVERLIVPAQSKFRDYMISEGLLEFPTLGAYDEMREGLRNILEAWEPFLQSKEIDSPIFVFVPAVVRKGTTTINHSVREPVPQSVISTLSPITLENCFDRCVNAVLNGSIAIVSFEEVNVQGHLLAIIFEARQSPGSEALSLYVIPHSLLQGLLPINEMINPSFDMIMQNFPSGFVPILWHFQQEVIPLLPAAVCSAIPCGLHLCSFSTFNAASIKLYCESLISEGGQFGLLASDLLVWRMTFTGLPRGFVVIRRPAGSWSSAIPCSRQEWEILKEEMNDNPRIIFKEAMVEGEPRPDEIAFIEEALYALLAAAYRPVEWCLPVDKSQRIEHSWG